MAPDTGSPPSRTLREKVRDEAQTYAIIFAYLYVCFGAILLYRDSVLEADGIPFAVYGVAVIKAAILGKFMLIGNNRRIGELGILEARIPAVAILRKATIFLVFLVALIILEEALLAFIHGHGIVQSLSEIGGRHWYQRIASCLLMWLILMPYFIIQKIGELLGPGVLRRMLFSRQ